MINSQLKRDYAACEALMKQHSKTFYAAFRGFDQPRAQAVYAIYAFCRIVDDYADVEHSLAKIEAHEQQFEEMLAGNCAPHFMWRALAHSFKVFNLEPTGFYAQIKGQKSDMEKKEIYTEVDLQDYCYLVAGSVGEMMLPLLTRNNDESAHQVALKLGEAMQITNILRDIGQDCQLGRCYVPQEVMQRFGYTKAMLQMSVLNDSFIQMVDYMIQWAHELYRYVEAHITVYREEVQTAMLLALYYYREILNKIIENKYDVFHKRAYVNYREKMQLAHLLKSKKKGSVVGGEEKD